MRYWPLASTSRQHSSASRPLPRTREVCAPVAGSTYRTRACVFDPPGLEYKAITIGFRVEHYPFGLPTMIVSLEAILLSTFVMVSQNRADEKRQVLADHQWQTAQEEEHQNEELPHLSNPDPGAHPLHPRAGPGARACRSRRHERHADPGPRPGRAARPAGCRALPRCSIHRLPGMPPHRLWSGARRATAP
jgi:hypothetical protein